MERILSMTTILVEKTTLTDSSGKMKSTKYLMLASLLENEEI